MANRSIEGTRFCVLGGTGFLGRHLCASLKREGAIVTSFGRSECNRSEGVKHIRGDFFSFESVIDAICGSEVVFHLISASTPASAEADRRSDLIKNVGGTIRLLDACVEMGIKRVVFASSGGTIYGAAAEPPFSEDMLPKPISSYGISKLAAENYLRLYNRSHGMTNVALRISNPYGPLQIGHHGQGVVGTFMRKILAGERIDVWGDGSVIRDYIFVTDVAQAFVAAAGYDGPDDTINIGSGHGRRLREVVASLADVLDEPVDARYSARRGFDVPVSVLDCRKAKAELGWHPKVSWEDGLRATADWMRRQTKEASEVMPI